MKINKKKFNSVYFLILFSFFICLVSAKYTLNKYDKNLISPEGKYYHAMIKGDVHRYFTHGFEIKEALKLGINYFETGRQNFTKYLFPRVMAIYYLIFDYNLFEDQLKNIIKQGIHFNYLIFQISLYYSCILFLYFQLRKIIDNSILFWIILFLSLEPTIFQYQLSFWSESIFSSMQIILIGLILNNTQKNIRYFFIGFVLSLLAIQRSNGFFYIVPILLYFYLTVGFKFNKKLPLLLIGYSIFLIFVGYHNYIRSNKFYIIPNEMKAVMHAYVIPNIISKESLEIEKSKTINFIKVQKLEINNDQSFKRYIEQEDYSRYSFIFCENEERKENAEYLKVCNYLEKRSYELIFSNLVSTAKYITKQSMHFILLNPFHIYSDNQFISGKVYYGSELHQKLLPYRMIYSFIIYSICLLGLFKIIKLKDKKILLFLFISILYFFLILSWHGNTRYFLPILFYLSFFFAFGVADIYKIVKSNLLTKKLSNNNFIQF
jgi:hypothetical protein